MFGLADVHPLFATEAPCLAADVHPLPAFRGAFIIAREESTTAQEPELA